MARQILNNVKAVQEFKDRNKREEDAAYKFFVENKDTYCSSENLGTASKIIRHKMEMNNLRNDRCNEILRAAHERRKKADAEYERKIKELERNELKIDSLPTIDPMRPVSPKVRATLFEGISATGGGRARYLKLRNEKDPEDKYNFKFPSSWDYGWYFKEMVKMDEIKKPYHHSDIIKNTLFNRNKIPLEGIDEIVQKKRFV